MRFKEWFMGIWKPVWAWLWGVRGQQRPGCEKTTASAGADTTQDTQQWIEFAEGMYSLEPELNEVGSQEPMVGADLEPGPEAPTEISYETITDITLATVTPVLEDVIAERKRKAEELLKQLKEKVNG